MQMTELLRKQMIRHAATNARSCLGEDWKRMKRPLSDLNQQQYLPPQDADVMRSEALCEPLERHAFGGWPYCWLLGLGHCVLGSG